MTLKDDAVGGAVALLDSPDANVRCLALQFLGRVGPPRLAVRIADFLWNEDLDVCYDAVAALGALGDSAAAAPLWEFYRAVPSGDHRVAVLAALGQIGGKEAERQLISVLEHRDASWDEVMTDDWDDYRDARLKALEALGRLGGSRAIPVICDLLRSTENEDLYGEGVRALTAMGPDGHEALCQLLPGSVPWLQWRIADALGNLGDPKDEKSLRILLSGEHPKAQTAALSALARLGAFLGREELAPWLHHADPALRLAAVDHVAALPAETVAEEWLGLLNDSDAMVRQAAVTAAGKTGLQAFASVFHRRINDPDQSVQLASLEALARLDAENLAETLLPILQDTGQMPLVRLRILSILARRPTPSLRETMMACLRDRDPAIRCESLAALARMDEAGAPALLIQALGGTLLDPSPEPAAESTGAKGGHAPVAPAGGIGPAGPEQAIAPPEPPGEGPTATLDAVMHPEPAMAAPEEAEPAPTLSSGEQNLLNRINADTRIGEEKLQQRNRPADLDLRIHAAQLLAEYHSEEALELLLHALSEPIPPLQEEAARTLGGMLHRDAVDSLALLLASPHPTVCDAAIKALTRIGGDGAKLALREGATSISESVRPALLEAFHELGDTESEPILRESLHSGNPAVVKAAARAVLSLGLPAGLDDLLRPLAEYPNYHWKGIGEGLTGSGRNGIGIALVSRLAAPAAESEIPLLLNLLEEMSALEG